MNNEDYIKGKIGRDNPFKVPDGYFEDFASRLMLRIPEGTVGEAKPAVKRTRTLTFDTFRYWAAACLCAVAFSTAFYFATHGESGQYVAEYNSASGAGSYEDALIDYAMMDNADMYACLSAGE